MIFNTHYPYIGGGGGGGVPQFEYTGQYSFIDDGGGNWRIKFLSSGVFTPLKDMLVDEFLVGGGAGGSNSFGGGGGGYTKTVKKTKLNSGTKYNIEIGAGGGVNGTGGTTSAFGNTVSGGSPVMAATVALAVEVKCRRGLAMVIAPVVLDKEQLQENLKK